MIANPLHFANSTTKKSHKTTFIMIANPLRFGNITVAGFNKTIYKSKRRRGLFLIPSFVI